MAEAGSAPASTRRAARIALAAYALSAPAVLLMVALLLLPVAAVVGLSMTDWLFGAKTLSFVGFENYREMFQDKVFWKSLGNTFVYVATVVPGSFALGLAVALLIRSATSLATFYRAVYFLPMTASLLAMAIVWQFMYHPTIGLINLLLEQVGIEGYDWLTDKDTALFALAAIGVWQAAGFNMVLFLAGLASIPSDLYEAAEVDGADNPWERFRLVTWPMLGPVSLFVIVISAIRSFQVFDTVEVLTEGGPNKATEVLLHWMYLEGFKFFRTGYAAAITIVFLVFILALVLAQMKLFERRTHYG